MKSPETLSAVSEFHNTFKHPISPKPTMPAEKRCALRVALLREELEELEEAIAQKDLVAVADALCDLQYVLSGAVLEFGLGDKFAQLFEEVQRSNMSKTCKTEAEAQETVRHYQTEKQQACYYEKSGEVYLVFRKSDGKTLKSTKYSPPNLKKIIS